MCCSGYADMARANFSFAQVAVENFRHANLRQASLEGARSLHVARWGSTVCTNGKLNLDARPCRR